MAAAAEVALPAAVTLAQAAAPTATTPDQALVQAAFGQGLRVQGQAGDLAMQLRGFLQMRAAISANDADPKPGITQRHAQVHWNGTAASSQLQWRLQFGFAPTELKRNSIGALQDAYARYTGRKGLFMQAGRFKLPYRRQRLYHVSVLQLTDLSIATNELHLGRDVGVTGGSDDVFGSGGHLALQGFVIVNQAAALGVRAQVRPFGSFDETTEADVSRSTRPGLVIGGSAVLHLDATHSKGTHGEPFTGKGMTYEHLAADVLFKYAGFSLAGEWLWRQAQNDSEVVTLGDTLVRNFSRSAWDAHVQAVQMIGASWQAAARYAELHRIGDTDPTLLSQRELAAGASLFFAGHNLKVQGEVSWLSPKDLKDGSFATRAQAQLYF
ncbi:MAG: hypothetical protein EXR77_08105 [Myxococcales bacterium]|nr:hypothetical protein [Myxococcales bacterium]